MNENLLSPCRACGKMISKNLVSTDTHRGSYHQATIRSGSCPNCGEAEPHLTQEDIERRKEQQKINKILREAQHELEEKRVRKENIWAWVGVSIGLCIGIAFMIALVLWLSVFFGD